MEKKKVNSKRTKMLVLAAIMSCMCLVFMFVPFTVKADNAGVKDVTTYSQLISALSDNSVTGINIKPSETFWNGVGTGVNIDLNKYVYVNNDWTIPSGVTITNSYSNSGSYNRFDGNVRIAGTWNQDVNVVDIEDAFVIENGGNYVANKELLVKNMSVETGGTLTVKDWLIVTGELRLKSGASVIEGAQAGNKSPYIMLSHATISGENATVSVQVSVNSGYTASDSTENAVLAGTLNLEKGLNMMYGGTDLDITGTVSISQLVPRFGDSNDKVVVKSGGSMILSGGSLQDGSKLLVENGGTLKGQGSPHGFTIYEGAKLTLNGTLEIANYLKYISLNGTSGLAIEGTGTIALGTEGMITNGRTGIADTIKITGFMADEYPINPVKPEVPSTPEAPSIPEASAIPQTPLITGTSETPVTPTGVVVKSDVIVTVNKVNYKVVSMSEKTVQYSKPLTNKATVEIPATVKIDGTVYKVTSVATNAFKNNKTVKKITIGKNIQLISKKAFWGCKKLKTIIIKTTKLTSKKISSQAFKGINTKLTIKVPKNKLSVYKRLFKKKGIPSKTVFKKI